MRACLPVKCVLRNQLASRFMISALDTLLTEYV